MRWTCLLLGLLVLTFIPARAGHSPPTIILRVNVQTTGEGLSPQEATTITLPPDGEQIQIRTLPEASEQQLIGVRQDGAGLHLKFNHVAQVDLNAATAQNQGRILVVTIDGYVVYAPVIDEQINNGELDIPHPVSDHVLQLLEQQAAKNVAQAARV